MRATPPPPASLGVRASSSSARQSVRPWNGEQDQQESGRQDHHLPHEQAIFGLPSVGRRIEGAAGRAGRTWGETTRGEVDRNG